MVRLLFAISMCLLTGFSYAADSGSPYMTKPVRIYNACDKVYIDGTLTMPDTGEKYPLIIFIAGSGRLDRDEKINNYKPFYLLSDFLTKKGYATFRYDKRGVGKSTGSFYDATTVSFVSDAEAVVAYFRKDSFFSKQAIGLLGHSEGGYIAGMLAAKFPKDISFTILAAAPGVTGKTLFLKQAETGYKNQGLPTALSLKWYSALEKVYEIAINGTDTRTEKKMMKKILEESEFPKKGRDEFINNAVHPWTTGMLKFDPREYLGKIRCPVLAIIGNMDVLVDSKENLSSMENSLKNGMCKNYKSVELPYVNHYFQKVDSQRVDDFKGSENKIAEVVLDTIGSWLNELSSIRK
jgi:pimeloyl-ACP methyl ester carboxylesterase